MSEHLAWNWIVSGVFTQRGFMTMLRTDFDATLAECKHDDLSEQERQAAFEASRSLGHRFVVWLNWRVYDLRRLAGAISPAVNGSPWWPG